MVKYMVESIGYNDGHPYEEFTSDDLKEVGKQFKLICEDQPKVAHRLIEVLSEREAICLV